MYDTGVRRVIDGGLLLVFAAVIAPLAWLSAADPQGTAGLWAVTGSVALVFTGLFALVHVMINAWIRIDLADRKVFQLYKLFGRPVAQKSYDLSRFDRISLHRAFRGGYQATLVAPDREVLLASSGNLGAPGRGADCRLQRTEMRDQL